MRSSDERRSRAAPLVAEEVALRLEDSAALLPRGQGTIDLVHQQRLGVDHAYLDVAVGVAIEKELPLNRRRELTEDRRRQPDRRGNLF